MKVKELVIQSIMAGIAIGIGGAFYLAIDNKIVGAMIFTLGLFTICTRGLHLFTGRVGYAVEQPPIYSASLVITWFGNLVGTNIVALLLRCTRQSAAFAEKAAGMVDTKVNDSLLSLFILGIFCNILMYLAVDGFKKNPHELGKYLGLFMCVGGFILAGFEHCVANMFYYGMANAWNAKSIIALLAVTAGNIVGGLIFPFMQKVVAEK